MSEEFSMVYRLFKGAFPFFLLFLFSSISVQAQVVLNEFLSSNLNGRTDEDGDRSDWIELYNPSDQVLHLKGYVLNDDPDVASGWIFPEATLPPRSFLLVFASGKDRKAFGAHYQTIIDRNTLWRYSIPSGSTSVQWRNTGYNAASWSQGKSGFGYGDNDDATILNRVETLFVRTEFALTNVDAVCELLLHVDYDDAFIAFINGVMVAMGGISEHNGDYTEVSLSGDHEAMMYNGGHPEEFVLNNPSAFLREGANVLALQGYNISASSSDFSLIPFLTVGSTDYTEKDTEAFVNTDNRNLHTDFKIASEGERIYLFDPASVAVDSAPSTALPPDVSYGRFPDGSDAWAYFTVPSPGDQNNAPAWELTVDSVFFDREAGRYTSPFSVTMTAQSNQGVIRYTTDGSEPTLQSTQYTSPVSISRTTVLRARLYRENIGNNPVTTHTYYFRDSNGLPVVSLSTHPDNFYDYHTGILVEGPNAQPGDPHFGANYWQDWERPVHLEYFDPHGHRHLSQGAGVQVYGSWSRANPSKSLALFARSDYGKGSFDYPFFHDRENKSFETFIIRNAGNDWGYSYIRDGLASETARKMNIDRLAFQPTAVYLNGEYYGILNMREKPNEHYFSDN
ncbi:MAG TPA: chitobiase/beta-hexosaminidase C-terminal domain-containing protein, partial [Prolixibacteraceae bacterium]|nr:chitobiase/beta-hexosaminidase C-terminal domain-containing protein [Prolixibacteraceae bacterium]